MVASLKERVEYLEGFEKKCNKAERRTRELERERRDAEDGRRILAMSTRQLEEYERLKDRNNYLTSENSMLRWVWYVYVYRWCQRVVVGNAWTTWSC